MGIGKRILDLARANLNALLDKAAGDAKVEELSDEELAAELERRKERKRREEASRKAAAAAEQAARIRAAQRAAQSPPPKSSTGPVPRQAQRPPPRQPPPRQPMRPPTEAQRIARLYATLETPVGSNLDAVKHNFRKLMRKYHPDVNAGTPERLKAATEKSASITAAYSELEKLLAKK